MDTSSLIATGLTPLQASAYSLLIELGQIRPPLLATRLKVTRTNAYKVLDKLAELRLATKQEEGKTLVYQATNPLALASLTAEYRSEATAREEATQAIMHELLARYHMHSDKPGVTVATGRKEVAEVYRSQINLHEDIYFIHTDADVTMMSFNTMQEIRTTPARYGKQRKAIMFPGGRENITINHEQHRRSNLESTYADAKDYNAPVEWSVTDSSLLIVLYATEPHAILIVDSIVAGAFLQLWKLLQMLLQQQPTHQALKKEV